MIDRHLATLQGAQIPALVRLAWLPETIRGYGHVKEGNIGKTMVEKTRLEAELENARFAAAAE